MWIKPDTQSVFSAHHEIRTAFPHISMPEVLTDDIIEFLGLEEVTAGSPPMPSNPYEHVEDDGVEQVEDQWVRKYKLVSVSPETALNDKLAQILTDREAAFDAGMPYTFGEALDAVQTRPQDQINLITIYTVATELNAAGVTEPVMEFRALSDTSYWMTPQETLAMTSAVRSFGSQIYQTSWARKNALAAIDLGAPDALAQIAAI